MILKTQRNAKIIKTILLPRCFHALISLMPIIGIPNLQL